MGPDLRTRLAGAVARAKRTPAADVARRVKRRLEPTPPLLSVVVPFHEAAGTLEACLDSLLGQAHHHLEVVLVDDGSVDGSVEVARRYVRRHRRRVVLVSQDQQGVGAARNAGVQRATGEYLAFCDADDRVDPMGYQRMVEALATSGSDLCVGAMTLQRQGRHDQPAWTRRSNPRRALGVTLGEHPQIMANLMPGVRVFRRTFWDRHRLAFPVEGDHSDVVTVVRAMLLADRFDVLPAVVYHWCWRPDGRSLWQRGLVDGERAADRVARLRDAGALVVSEGSQQAQTVYFADVLHTTVPDLVRASVTRQDGYWERLGAELAGLLSVVPAHALAQVPVEDRIAAWLCAHDRRGPAEQFLEYAVDNQTGFPHHLAGGRATLELPFIDGLEDVPADMTVVSPTEMRYRTRLMALRWVDGRLLLAGAAFVEYLPTPLTDRSITVVLTDEETGQEIRLGTEPAPELDVNNWAHRANEDHTDAGFVCVVDAATLAQSGGGPRELLVDVELEVGEQRWRDGVQTRAVSGSASLLETGVVDDVAVEPVWRRFRGLRLDVRSALPADRAPRGRPGGVRVDGLDARDGVLRVHGTSDRQVDLALVGPRGQTDWAPMRRRDGRFEAELDVLVDEWGAARTALPADRYQLRCRTSADKVRPVVPHADLWRTLPAPFGDGDLLFQPMVADDGTLDVRVIPAEWPGSRTPYLRRRLRDEVYPWAREQPLVDVALFETFAGKAAGDNPGALCRELADRGLDVELVVSVLDRSVVVPEGARGVIRFSEEYFELLGRARYLLVNASLPYFFRKREGQLYFQTWHGTPLKRIAHDRPHLDFFNWHHRRQLLIARDGWDYLLSQSEFCTRALSSAFRYDGPVLELGYPRNDVMSSDRAEETRRRVRRNLGLAEGTFVVLYAPTWRDNLRVGRVFDKVLYLDPHRLVAELDDSAVLVRGHYNSVQAAESTDPERRVLDVTRYPDIADLYLAADALVTDYSSVYFDFVLTDKPIVFLAPDLVQYRDDNRGFYLDYDSTVPGPICLTTDEVVDRLRGPDTHLEERKRFRAEYAPHDDGHASARVVDAVLAWRDRQPG